MQRVCQSRQRCGPFDEVSVAAALRRPKAALRRASTLHTRARLLGRSVVLLIENPVALMILGSLDASLFEGADMAILRCIGFPTIDVRLAALE